MIRFFSTLLLCAAVASPGVGQAATTDPACTKSVNDAFAKLKAQQAFRLETTIKNADGVLNLRVDYVLPDRMHQTVTMGKDGPPMELIVIGSNAWSNQGSGWVQLPENFAQTVAKQMQDTLASGTSAGIEYKCLGSQNLDGKPLTAFQGALPMPIPDDGKERGPRVAALSVPKVQKVYIDDASGLPIRNIVTAATDPDKRLFDGTFSIAKGVVIEVPKVAEPPAAPPAVQK